MYASEQSPENAFVVGFCAADGFFYPVVDGQVVLLAETGDFEALVFDGLVVVRNSDVSVGHSVFLFFFCECKGNFIEVPVKKIAAKLV